MASFNQSDWLDFDVIKNEKLTFVTYITLDGQTLDSPKNSYRFTRTRHRDWSSPPADHQDDDQSPSQPQYLVSMRVSQHSIHKQEHPLIETRENC